MARNGALHVFGRTLWPAIAESVVARLFRQILRLDLPSGMRLPDLDVAHAYRSCLPGQMPCIRAAAATWIAEGT